MHLATNQGLWEFKSLRGYFIFIKQKAMRLVCFSDTHGCHPYISIPDGDILIFAGDMCSYGHGKEAKRFINWMRELPHMHKIFIA